jgi:hypothetical protein
MNYDNIPYSWVYMALAASTCQGGPAPGGSSSCGGDGGAVALMAGVDGCSSSGCPGGSGALSYCSYGQGGLLPSGDPSACPANYLGGALVWGLTTVPDCPTREL